MTVPVEVNKIVHDCNGTQTEFSFSFIIFEDDDVDVILTNAAGVETTLTLGSDYTMDRWTTGGGKVTTTTAYPVGNTITISLDMDFDQPTNLLYAGTYLTETIEKMVDRCVKMIQQLAQMIGDGGECGDISDEPYDANTWNGIKNIAPSKNAVRDKFESQGSATDKDYEDVLSDGDNLPTGHAVKVYGDSHWGVSGSGDVIGPATHHADYVPQWNGTANSKTLVEGFPITALGKSLVNGASASAMRAVIDAGFAADYIVHTDGSTYYATGNGAYGLSDYQDTAFNTLVNNLISILATKGGKIYFAPGTYNVTGPISGNLTGIVLEGPGPAMWGSLGAIFENTYGGSTIHFDPTNNTEIRRILFTNSGATNTQPIIYMAGSSDTVPVQNVKIIDCGFSGIDFNCIFAEYAYDIYVTRCGFSSCPCSSGQNIGLGVGCNAWYFEQCRFESMKAQGIYADHTDLTGIIINNCKFHGWRTDKHRGVHFADDCGDFSRITGNFFYDCGGTDGDMCKVGADGIIVNNNNFNSSDGLYSLNLTQHANRCVVEGNTFYTPNTLTGHVANIGTDNILVGNSVYDVNDLVAGGGSLQAGFNSGWPQHFDLKASGTQTLASGATWVPGYGLFNITALGCDLELYADGAWQSTGKGITGAVYFDGSNQRIVNNDAATQYVYWQRS